MKLFYNILKLLTALAVIAGIVYVVIAYGDKIVAWVKKILRLDCCCDMDCCCDGECCEDDFCEAVVESAAENVQAEENDFE